jgi:hypothetical protein
VITLDLLADLAAVAYLLVLVLAVFDVVVPVLPSESAVILGNFWIQLPNNRPYLIHIGEDLAASGASVVNGDTVTVAGTVHLMGDSTLTAWRSSGVLTDDLQVEEARFATSYLDARAIR